MGCEKTYARNNLLRDLAIPMQLKMRELRECFALRDIPKQVIFCFVPYVNECKTCETIQ